ncbi:hypothetical protein [Pelagibacter phage HTVC010P]|uniref:hypothetical protein n=1 Tax=Pelagibacter phage HTVC010P TaxID=1283077 RepID=UPI0002B29E1C|nr:hypothetical protein I900_gp25 [Pelagibacter phage HTVC010P]AGE60295.1 hypothetical protein [Pelagibacter phage HTVC010P]
MIATAANTNGPDRSYFKFQRGTTDIGIGDASGSRYRASTGNFTTDTNKSGNFTFVWYDSPSSTSEQTYKLQVTSNGNSKTVYMNQVQGTATDSVVMASQIILMEVAG